ncbi:DUF4157 domain-containing protein [Chryseobacterium gambrini]|uniref:eCIS core domain-containing protein n=1 Tax=Chryseobacterium gambrini TaxID=373672 RepID=UPI003D0C3305
MEAVNLQREQKQTSKKNNSTFFKPAIQKKLSVGSANDSYEVEADKVADKVMKMSKPSPQVTHTGALLQRKCAHCEQEEKLQMKPLAESISPLIQRSSSEIGGVAPSQVENQINSSRGGGSVMDHETKNFMENRFGTDFSNVKIHTGSEAVQMSRELNAQAFAVGNDIYFNEGKYNPTSDSGKHLLAHELTHTVQQSGGVGRKIQKQHLPGGPYHPPEGTVISCSSSDTCSQLSLKINYLRHTIQSHIAWDIANPNPAYPSGRHADEIIELQNALQNCINYTIRCRNQPIFTPVPVERTSDASDRRRDPDFMRRMAEITGLTGTALLIYLIISEGSRLFPPRNLIPVP